MARPLITLGIAAAAGVVIGSTIVPVVDVFAQTKSNETFRGAELFGEVFEIVRDKYVEDVGDKELFETAINGMLTALDPHSAYLDQSRYREMQVETEGEFGGLGIEVTMENGLVRVVSPIDDTPAWRAGIEAGDLITHIDGEAVMGLSLGEAVEKMRGPVDSEIDLRLLREGLEEPLEVSLNRAVIQISPVKARVLDDIGYIRLTTFNKQTGPEMEEEIEEMKAELGDEMHGFVLDLRNNPGGLLDQAVAVSDAFLERGEIVSTRGRENESIQRYNAREGDVLDGLPMVVLINAGSASASEIVAGALQDHRRAIVMGMQSFGKGSVQTIMPISGQGAIRLTTARYYTPAGTSIQAKGIAPDIAVRQANVELLENQPRRREADLRGSLDNDQDAEDEAIDEVAGEATVTPEDDDVDYQLERAVDLLRGISLYEARLDEDTAN